MMFSSVEILKREVGCINRRDACYCNRDCFRCDLSLWGVDLREALNDAIEALENKSKAEEYRTPMKVVYKLDDSSDHTEVVGICPRCHGWEQLYDGERFCSECGQAIDWSEEEGSVPVMRPATKDERDNIDKYIDSISTKTGANFSDK